MWFNLKNAFELETFRAKVVELENKGAMVELKEKRGRSLNQNAYLHLLLSAFGLQYGYTLDEVKTHFYKLVVNKDIFLREGVDKFTGECYKYLRSSADLTKDEMSKSISDCGQKKRLVLIFPILMNISHYCIFSMIFRKTSNTCSSIV